MECDIISIFRLLTLEYKVIDCKFKLMSAENMPTYLNHICILFGTNWAGPQMPTTKNIERQFSVGDPISRKNSTSAFTGSRVRNWDTLA